MVVSPLFYFTGSLRKGLLPRPLILSFCIPAWLATRRRRSQRGKA